MRRLRSAVHRAWQRTALFKRNRRGGAALLIGLMGTVLIGMMAIGVDGTSFFLTKRRQQSATDLAAMAAAAAPAASVTQASGMMAANGFPSAVLQVVAGNYTPNSAAAPAARFTPLTDASGNAVRVVSTTTQPFIFGSVLATLMRSSAVASGFTIRTEAVARRTDVAAFTLGSGLASMNAGLLNAMLGSLFGSRVSLSLLDYQALAAASVDLFDLDAALASRLQLSGATYGGVLAQATAQTTLLASLADALGGSAAGAAAATRSLAASLPPGGALALTPLIDFGAASDLAVTAPHPLSARVSALDFVTALARLAGNGRLVSLDLGSVLPGLTTAQLQMTLGEPTQGSGYFAVGPEGVTLHTAQTRLLLTTQVGGAGLPASMTVPFYVELAPASATITAIACQRGAAQASVTLGVAPGLARAAIGSLASGSFLTLSSSPALSPATVLDLPLVLRVTALGDVTASAPAIVPVPFAASEIAAGTRKTVSSGVSLASLLASLAGNTRFTVTTLGLTLPQPALAAAAQTALVAAVTPVDLALEQILALLGVSVGNATTSVTGVHCGQGLLVN